MRVIVPVRNEAENVQPLLQQIAATGVVSHVDFIDDSPDDRTTAAIDASTNGMPFEVTYLHRGSSGWGGLAGAVIDGLDRAKQQNTLYVAVMDGDLQHDPAYLPSILESLQSGAEVVVTSRYVAGGSREGLDGPVRYFVSWASTRVAKMLFPHSLAAVSDPMTGYFGIRLGNIDLGSIRKATGFKILLELLVTHPELTVREVPVVFRTRIAGTSKGTMARGLEYLQQLLRLRYSQMRKQQLPAVIPDVDPTR